MCLHTYGKRLFYKHAKNNKVNYLTNSIMDTEILN